MCAILGLQRRTVGIATFAWVAVIGANAWAQATINIDIPARPITGTFTMDGETPPASQYESGRVYLRDFRSGDQVLLGLK